MNFYSIPNACAASLLLGLGLLVAFKTRGRWDERILSFIGFCASTFTWQFFYCLAYNTPDETAALILLKIGYAGVIFMPIASLHYVASLIAKRGVLAGLIRLGYVLAVMYLALLATDSWFFRGLHRYFFGFYPKVFAPVHLSYLAFLSTCVTTSIIILFLEWRRIARQGRSDIEGIGVPQLKLVCLAYVLVASASVDFLPNYGIAFYPLGFVGVVLFCGVTAYTILRYNLYDIQIIIKRTLVFTGLSLIVLMLVGAISLGIPALFLRRFSLHIGPFWPNLVSFFVAVGVFERLKSFLARLTDRYLFQQRYDPSTLLKRFTADVMGLVDLRQLVQMTVATLMETVKPSGCGLWLVEKSTGRFAAAASRGLPEPAQVLEPQDPLIAHLGRTKAPVGLDGPLAKPPAPEPVARALEPLAARLCLPLILNDQLIGFLALGAKKSDAAYDQDDLEMLLPLARTLSIAISNAQLFGELATAKAEVAEALTDALTGVFVRRAFMDRAHVELARTQHYQQACTVLMIDLDHFKEKNDTHGHLVGDVVLHEVAARLQRRLRARDLLGRYGGEEFILLLAETPPAQAAAIADRLRQTVASLPISTSEITLTQTLSIGMAGFPEDGATLEALIAKADQALYAAKRAGRDRVMRLEGGAHA